MAIGRAIEINRDANGQASKNYTVDFLGPDKQQWILENQETFITS